MRGERGAFEYAGWIRAVERRVAVRCVSDMRGARSCRSLALCSVLQRCAALRSPRRRPWLRKCAPPEGNSHRWRALHSRCALVASLHLLSSDRMRRSSGARQRHHEANRTTEGAQRYATRRQQGGAHKERAAPPCQASFLSLSLRNLDARGMGGAQHPPKPQLLFALKCAVDDLLLDVRSYRCGSAVSLSTAVWNY